MMKPNEPTEPAFYHTTIEKLMNADGATVWQIVQTDFPRQRTRRGPAYGTYTAALKDARDWQQVEAIPNVFSQWRHINAKELTSGEKATRTRKLLDLADYAADTAMKLQATSRAPRDFVYRAHQILEKHRAIRPEMYGPSITQPKWKKP